MAEYLRIKQVASPNTLASMLIVEKLTTRIPPFEVGSSADGVGRGKPSHVPDSLNDLNLPKNVNTSNPCGFDVVSREVIIWLMLRLNR